MSQNVSDASVTFPRLLPSFSSHQAVQQFWMKYPSVWEHFLQLPVSIQRELLDFCIGKSGLRITYDPVFRRVFQPKTHKKRLESLLSSILGKNVSILEILPREGTRLTETGSFVIMDILVRLDDGSYANVEMQKIGYNFPLARADCYASDIIMRQYEKTKILTTQDSMKIYLSALTFSIQSYIIYLKEVHCRKHGLPFSVLLILIVSQLL